MAIIHPVCLRCAAHTSNQIQEIIHRIHPSRSSRPPRAASPEFDDDEDDDDEEPKITKLATIHITDTILSGRATRRRLCVQCLAPGGIGGFAAGYCKCCGGG